MEEPHWANLPKHILDSILGKLESSMDFLRFSGVCVLWHENVKNNQIRRNKMLRQHHAPMLFIPSEEEEECTWIIYDIINNKCLESKLEIPYDKRFCGSSEGWLVATDINYEVSLYKPYSFLKGEKNVESISIQLPSICPKGIFYDSEDNDSDSDDDLEDPNFDFYIYRTIITADPLENSDDCRVIAIIRGSFELALIKPGKNTSWTKIDARRLQFRDILYYNNQLYGIDVEGRLMSFEFRDWKYIISTKLRTSDFIGRRYLVKSYYGDLLQVERHIEFWYDEINGHQRATKKFKIFKLDFEHQKWVEVRSLGDSTLFLGDNSSICVLASNFVGCQPNCIYFTHDDDTISSHPKGLFDSGIYNVETKSVLFHFSMDSTIFAKMSGRPPIWVVPTLNLY
ncbi:hypothetical protein UlMin_007363 [Ulmus minor]